jgi:hypothetical protein
MSIVFNLQRRECIFLDVQYSSIYMILIVCMAFMSVKRKPSYLLQTCTVAGPMLIVNDLIFSPSFLVPLPPFSPLPAHTCEHNDYNQLLSGAPTDYRCICKQVSYNQRKKVSFCINHMESFKSYRSTMKQHTCSLSLWRAVRGSKPMHLELIHGLFSELNLFNS